MTILLPLLAFLFATALVAGAAWTLAPGSVGTMERRLGELTGAPMRETVAETSFTAGRRRPEAHAAWRPGGPPMGKLQQRPVAAGYRSSEAIRKFRKLHRRRGHRLPATVDPFIFRPTCRWRWLSASSATFCLA